MDYPEQPHTTQSDGHLHDEAAPAAGNHAYEDYGADKAKVVEGLEGEVALAHEWVVRGELRVARPVALRSTDPDGRPVIRAVAGTDGR